MEMTEKRLQREGHRGKVTTGRSQQEGHSEVDWERSELGGHSMKCYRRTGYNTCLDYRSHYCYCNYDSVDGDEMMVTNVVIIILIYFPQYFLSFLQYLILKYIEINKFVIFFDCRVFVFRIFPLR